MTDLVIITGASGGLGLALSRSVPFPARIIDISRSGPPESSGIEHLQADLPNVAGWDALIEEIVSIVGKEKPDRAVFIHNAGTLRPIGFSGEVARVEYEKNVILNSAAGQVLGNGFLEAVHGLEGTFDVVMITSGAASKAYPGWSAYGAGKAALEHWVRNVGAEQQIRGGVRLAAIAPGVLDTAMQAQIREQSEEDFPDVGRFRDLHQDDRLTSPEVAASKLWKVLESGFESGTILDLRSI